MSMNFSAIKKGISEDALSKDIQDSLSLQNHICILLYQASNKVARIYNNRLAEHGLTFSQYQVLVVLWEQGPSTVGAVCTALALDTSTITPVMKRLQSVGYIDRFRDRLDERRVYVSLTERGHAFRAEALELRCRLASDFGTTTAEFLALQHALRKISSAADAKLMSSAT